jgi:uncharacterized membrane protein YkvA (DUF1232 family)
MSSILHILTRRYRYSFKHEMFVLYFGIKDNRTPFFAKLVALTALIYLISPIDLIPDFIPFVGYLDDLIIVPALLHLAFLLLPLEVKKSGWERARKQVAKLNMIFFILICIILMILGFTFLIIRSILHHL